MENCIKIGQGDLTAWVARPGKRYNRTRFDWTGFIPQVALKGKTFCTPEGAPWHENDTGGEGLCNEFKASDEDMGFDDQDRLFLKPGVGLLERADNAPYHFGTDYRLVEPFPCTMRTGADYVDFHLGAIPLKGLAYTMDKHVGIIGDMLVITTTVTNMGQRAINLREYNHNFLSMDGQGAHPGVSLTLQKNYRDGLNRPGLVKHPDSISFTPELANAFMIYCDEVTPHSPMRWELKDDKAKMSIQEWGDFDIAGFAVWGGPHVVSPEIFVDFTLNPGQSRGWTRLWRFAVENLI